MSQSFLYSKTAFAAQFRIIYDTFLHMTKALERLLEFALPQHGFVTVQQAQLANVGPAYLRAMASRGTLEHRAQGLYRIVAIPLNDRSELMEATLWAMGRAVIGGESALLLWDIADVNPRRIELVLPTGYRPRRRGGDMYEVQYRTFATGDITEVDGVPVLNAALAIGQCIQQGTPGDLIEQAIKKAQSREHIGAREAARLLVQLDERAHKTRVAKNA